MIGFESGYSHGGTVASRSQHEANRQISVCSAPGDARLHCSAAAPTKLVGRLSRCETSRKADTGSRGGACCGSSCGGCITRQVAKEILRANHPLDVVDGCRAKDGDSLNWQSHVEFSWPGAVTVQRDLGCPVAVMSAAVSRVADGRAQALASGLRRTADGATRGEALLHAVGIGRADRGIERVAHDAADHRLRLKWESRSRSVPWRGRGCGVGALGVSRAAFAGGLHGGHCRVQLRTAPMVTGMMSLTSTVNRYIRLALLVLLGSKKGSSTS
jgi:hypothetical protein